MYADALTGMGEDGLPWREAFDALREAIKDMKREVCAGSELP